MAATVVWSSRWAPVAAAPACDSASNLRDAGLPVGALEVGMELRPLLAHTATIGGVASLLGLVAVGLFYWFP